LDENELKKLNLNNTQEEIIKIRSNSPFQNWDHLISEIPEYPKEFKDFTFF
jgi:hypothetical protein